MTPAVQQTEAQFERAVIEYAELNGWRVYHTYDSRRSNAGYPDLTLVRLSRLVFAELKTEKGRVSKAQQEWLDALNGTTTHIEIYLWRPSDWSEVEATLRR